MPVYRDDKSGDYGKKRQKKKRASKQKRKLPKI
jgi:hypothetical protein